MSTSTLLENAAQALPVTHLARKLKLYLDKISNKEQEKYVVMRNNKPAAVLLSVEQFEEITNELEDLRIEIAAQERLASFDGKTTISHDDMVREFKGS